MLEIKENQWLPALKTGLSPDTTQIYSSYVIIIQTSNSKMFLQKKTDNAVIMGEVSELGYT